MTKIDVAAQARLLRIGLVLMSFGGSAELVRESCEAILAYPELAPAHRDALDALRARVA